MPERHNGKFYVPKGGLCASCEHSYSDCSGHDFNNMIPLSDARDFVYVKCTHWQRALTRKDIKEREAMTVKTKLIQRMEKHPIWVTERNCRIIAIATTLSHQELCDRIRILLKEHLSLSDEDLIEHGIDIFDPEPAFNEGLQIILPVSIYTHQGVHTFSELILTPLKIIGGDA